MECNPTGVYTHQSVSQSVNERMNVLLLPITMSALIIEAVDPFTPRNNRRCRLFLLLLLATEMARGGWNGTKRQGGEELATRTE